jgi:penicillin-binding protein 1A
VWVGFDKPQTIYRGAFSNEVALPIWAKVIGATFANYRPQEIAMPAGVIKAEICTASGELATPRCVEIAQNKDTGESISRRTTYFEIGSEKNLPKNACTVHNGGVSQSFLKVIPGAQWPRATAAVNVAEKAPVVMKGPTVIGESDPYNSVLALNNAFAAKALDGQVAPLASSAEIPAPAPVEGNQPEVRRAAAVGAAEQMEIKESAIKLDPPEPIKF